ncbi:hypothetical protein BJ875DRAFT_440477 [Amylocarpus encephaloides]|uniref:Uncharacterized protein n=1 Tax=Amylocarpus encephaloides TaxID=45428 RepID=A0A9P7YKN0_9HELO|nr:hypothetical protein BJ875DRAFT_440477 [Amylocarpus encephaloides]
MGMRLEELLTKNSDHHKNTPTEKSTANMLRAAGTVRNWSSNKDWGLKVPGRPPTPSEGAAQQYYRFGAANQQDILSFDNGTCLEFGPMDQVDEWILGYHPFSEQVALIDKSISDILVVRDRYPNGIATQGPFANFRTIRAPTSMITYRNTDSGIYAQVPSKHRSVTEMISVYSPVAKVDAIGQALPAEGRTDSRYGTTGRPPPEAIHKYPRQGPPPEHPQQAPFRPAQDRPGHHRPAQPRQEYYRPGQPPSILNSRTRRLQRRAIERTERTERSEHAQNQGAHVNHQLATRRPYRAPRSNIGTPSTMGDDSSQEGRPSVQVRTHRPPGARVDNHHHGRHTLAEPTHDGMQMPRNDQYVYPPLHYQHGTPPGFSQRHPYEHQGSHRQFNDHQAMIHGPTPDGYSERNFSQPGGQIRPPPGLGYPPQSDTFPRGNEFIQPEGFANHRHQLMQYRASYRADGNDMTSEPRVEVMPATPERGSYPGPEEDDGQDSIMSGRASPLMSYAAERRTTSQPVFRPSNGLLSAVMSQPNLSMMSMPARQNEGLITPTTPAIYSSLPASGAGFARATSPSLQLVLDDMNVTGASSSARDVRGRYLNAGNLPNTIFGEQPGAISRGPSPSVNRGRGLGRRLYEQSDARGSTSQPGRVGHPESRTNGVQQRSTSDELS